MANSHLDRILGMVNPFKVTATEAATRKFDSVNRTLDSADAADARTREESRRLGMFRARYGALTKRYGWEPARAYAHVVAEATAHPDRMLIDLTLHPDYRADVQLHGERVQAVGEAAANRTNPTGQFPPRNDAARPQVAPAQTRKETPVSDPIVARMNTLEAKLDAIIAGLSGSVTAPAQVSAPTRTRLPEVGAPAPKPAKTAAKPAVVRTVNDLTDAEMESLTDWLQSLADPRKRDYALACVAAQAEGKAQPNPIDHKLDPSHKHVARVNTKLASFGIRF